MKPLHLKFCGINSFSEEADIDFEQLTKNGLFGIFGDTGSGKSTILDAINFALYGEVERNKENKEMINYKSSSATVEFTFQTVEKGKTIIYTVERVLKKDKSGTHKAKLFRKDEEKEECIADKPQIVREKVVQILGVDKEDFRKCIAIPQGEFSQFVKSQPAERLKLIERLFNLTRYGEALKYKINNQLDLIDSEFDNLKGQLEVYVDDTEDKLTELNKSIEIKKKEVETLKNTSELFSKRQDKLNALHSKWKELKSKEDNMLALDRKKQEMDELNRDLSLLDKCRQIESFIDERKTLSEELEKQKLVLAKESDGLKSKTEQIEKLKSELKEGNFEGRIDFYKQQLTKYSTIEGKPEKLKGLKATLEQKREYYKKADEKKKSLVGQLEKIKSEILALETDLKATADNDINSIINIYYKNAILREEYIKELGWAVEFKQRAKRYEGDDELYKFISAALKNKIENYEYNIQTLNEFTFNLADEKLKDLNNFASQKENTGGKISSLSIEKAKIEGDLRAVEERIEEHIKSGVNDREQYDLLKNEIEAIIGKDTDLLSAKTNANREIEKLTQKKKTLDENIESLNNQIAESKLSIKEFQTQIGIHTKELDKKSTLISTSLEELKITKEECSALVKKYSSYQNAQESLDKYEKDYYSTKQAIESLRKLKDIDTINDDILIKFQREMEAAQTLYNEESGNLKVLIEQSTQIQTRLKKKENILKEYKVVESKRNLVAQLKELIKGNKFLEFVADEYLCDISTMASKTLITLTDGRYYLVYRGGNFSVCDNYDSGNLRNVNTLSGGETFLVSLSLALALSQTICARSLKSIEFFFLDEGFGTLDSNLIDTVMNALEKLKSSNFTIGVISHVEELKHRIDCKITVNKATESRGSTVQLSL